jgi:crossover junction endodeoxyribonuclease RuvC
VRILGIDPGYQRTGYAVLEASTEDKPSLVESGVFETSADEPFPQRLRQMRDAAREVIERLQPAELALEELYWSKNVKTAIAVAQARGVLMLAASELGLEVAEYSPTVLKLGLTGSGDAGKDQVKYMVEQMLKLPEAKRLDDEYDAIALALLHAIQKGFML